MFFYPIAALLSPRSRKVGDIVGFCALTLLIAGPSSQAFAQSGDRTQYIVDGLALGDLVHPNSSIYREYQCRSSEQFASFIWCKRRKIENGRYGQFTSVNSILHSADGATTYVSRYIEPAYFAPGDVEREISRLSQRFGSSPHILRSPQLSGNRRGVIAYWGDVTLKPLDNQSIAQLAAGQSVTKGMLFDFVGNFGLSANEGLPVFQLGGAAGYVWRALFDKNGKGSLRITAIDASQFTAPSSVAYDGSAKASEPETRRSVSPPAPQPSVNYWSGSGFFVSKAGHVVTNNHVIEKCSSIRVFMNQADAVDAREIARDTTNDVALLSTGLRRVSVAAPRWGSRVGEYVAAFGYPHVDLLATSGNFTQGNVTALAGIGDDSRYLQISTPVQSGNSGGPLLDQNGNLVGMVTSKMDALKMIQTSGDLPQNVNFALKASVIASFLDINGIKYALGSATSAMKPEELADQARSMSVFILCK